MEQWLYGQSEWLIFLMVLLLLVAAATAGALLARRAGVVSPSSAVSSIQSASLGLLALLLGFTFAMAAGRFQARRELILQEANAIGTAYLREQLLQEPERTNSMRLLRSYLDTRFLLHQQGFSLEKRDQAERLAEKLHGQLWGEVLHAAEKDRSPVTALAIAALNDVIDVHGEHMAALRNGVPSPIFLLLLFVAVVTLGMSGYASGPVSWQSVVMNVLLALLVAAVILLIVDLHRPLRGLITVDLTSMRDLARGMQPAP